ncbi:MAG: glucosidase [Chloroflexota bacterium]
MVDKADTHEQKRLSDSTKNWKHWGPYLSERAWGTVREDYSPDGEAWAFFPHDHARSKAYRWGEDGLAGISDTSQHLCFGLALWNGEDAILKERLFGLTGNQGNHGEDVKEYYFYLDSTPTHSYMKMLYKYPQAAFPYEDLIAENGRRGYDDFEYELLDTGIFDDDRYFDVVVEYAKADADDIIIEISVTNRGDEDVPCVVLPTLWFRNTWSWGYETGPMRDVPTKPMMRYQDGRIVAQHPALDTYYLYHEGVDDAIFTHNDTNNERLYDTSNPTPFVKDAFHRYIIHDEQHAINPDQAGTKSAYVCRLQVAAGDTEVITLRLTTQEMEKPFTDADRIISDRLQEANAFYDALAVDALTEDEKRVQRQALAGMLWTKQLFYYDVKQWLEGDPHMSPPESRQRGRNSDWEHLNNFDIISMPDKWEYPWYAGWDLAFHCIPLAMVDMDFAKEQLVLLTHEWYIHPNGQLPAYEWNFSDVNPPVHAWAAWRVFEMDGKEDTDFLKRIFHKMLINFTWWVNRKDEDGNNVFQGGFLGLDNISLFDRSDELPTGGHIDQSDGTAWMGFYCLVMMNIALELAKQDAVYENLGVKFYEHFLWIANASSEDAHEGIGLWDEHDNFYYDVLKLSDESAIPLKVRSLVGLLPLIAVETVGQDIMRNAKEFSRSIRWLQAHRPDLASKLAKMYDPDEGNKHLFAMPDEFQLRSVLGYMLDENEFLSEFGIRSMSKVHETPYELDIGGEHFSVQYWAAESKSGLFGGNSNWRGPIWFPINYLLIEAMHKLHHYYGDDFKVACPTGSDNLLTLEEVADELARRLCNIFLQREDGTRPFAGGEEKFQDDPHWRNHLLFHEYFNGDDGAGLGASHQTGWTGLVAHLLQHLGEKR